MAPLLSLAPSNRWRCHVSSPALLPEIIFHGILTCLSVMDLRPLQLTSATCFKNDMTRWKILDALKTHTLVNFGPEHSEFVAQCFCQGHLSSVRTLSLHIHATLYCAHYQLINWPLGRRLVNHRLVRKTAVNCEPFSTVRLLICSLPEYRVFGLERRLICYFAFWQHIFNGICQSLQSVTTLEITLESADAPALQALIHALIAEIDHNYMECVSVNVKVQCPLLSVAECLKPRCSQMMSKATRWVHAPLIRLRANWTLLDQFLIALLHRVHTRFERFQICCVDTTHSLHELRGQVASDPFEGLPQYLRV